MDDSGTPKYAVMKWGDFTHLFEPFDGTAHAHMAKELVIRDCVVIRYQDVFAASALWTYAGQIRTAIELMMTSNARTKSVRELQALADFFADAARAAESHPTHKVPD